MGDAALDQYRHGLVHLVADDSTGQRPVGFPLAHFTSAFSFWRVRTRAMSRRTLFSWLLLVSCCVAFCMRRPNCARSSSSSSLESCARSLARSSLAFIIVIYELCFRGDLQGLGWEPFLGARFVPLVPHLTK